MGGKGSRRGATADTLPPSSSQALGPAFSRAWAAATRAIDVVVDAAFAAAPPTVTRPTVDAAVKLGAVLLALSFARSMLGFVVTIGTIGLGLFVASRVLEADGGGGGKAARRGERGWGRCVRGGGRVCGWFVAAGERRRRLPAPLLSKRRR